MKSWINQIRENLVIILITFIAFANRIWRLDSPKGFIFDEVYYVKNANSLINHGVELSGTPAAAEFVVHPPLGKWLIGLGIQLFGNNEFGWRISAAVIGSALVPLIYLIAKHLFKSVFLANLCALLIALDGLALVMSRIALLDIFLTVFLLVAFLFWLKGNHLIAGIAIGAAISTKWNAAYIYCALIAYLLFFLTKYFKNISYKYLGLQLLNYVLIPALTYLISWTGWFLSSSGYKRNSSSNPIVALWNYHVEILHFHRNLTEPHSYSANPFGWLILRRPTSFYFESDNLGSSCGASKCAQEILALGTPVLWWFAIFCLFLLIFDAFKHKSRLAVSILAPFLSLYLPWLLITQRTTFYFYSITLLPFLVLAIGYFFHRIRELRPHSELFTLWIPISLVAIVAANFLYFLPIFMGLGIKYAAWQKLMWFVSWI